MDHMYIYLKKIYICRIINARIQLNNCCWLQLHSRRHIDIKDVLVRIYVSNCKNIAVVNKSIQS